MDKLGLSIENARGEILTALQKVQDKHNFPPCIMDLLLSNILNDIRAEVKIQLINESNQIIKKYESEKEMKDNGKD